MISRVSQKDDLVEVCASELAAAHRASQASANHRVFDGISRGDAFRVQHRVLSLLGESSDVTKVGINTDGEGVSAPIFSTHCGVSGHTFALPKTGFIGIEVEIAVRLAKDVTPNVVAGGHEALLSVIQSFHIGVELVATRFKDHDAVGPSAQLSDGINTFGFVHSEIPFSRGDDLSQTHVEVVIDDQPLARQPSTSAFGSILNPLIECGHLEESTISILKAGTLVTTGALSGLVPLRAPAHIRAGLVGFEPVTFQLAQPRSFD